MLHVDGYEIHRGIVNVDAYLDDLNNFSKKGSPIFNHNEHARSDRRRIQAHVTNSNLPVFSTLNAFLSKRFPNLEQHDWVVLRSLPGCQEQAAHCDYVPDQNLANATDEQMPLAVLVALMPESKLYVWPRSIGLVCAGGIDRRPIRKKAIYLSPGDVLIFRGDLVHAGADYAKENIRLHTFLDSRYVPRIANRTWLIDRHGSQELRQVIYGEV